MEWLCPATISPKHSHVFTELPRPVFRPVVTPVLDQHIYTRKCHVDLKVTLLLSS